MTNSLSRRPRIVFAGTPEFAVPSLAALTRDHHDVIDIVAVYTQPDRPAGRGRRLRPGPVKQTALHYDLQVRQPLSLRADGEAEALAALQPDIMIVAAYGLLLPQQILDIPRLGCVNVHASLLPRWRGAAPVQYAILAGDDVTGVTLMQMEAGLDTGPMLARRETAIGERESAGELTARLALLGGELLRDCLPQLLRGELSAEAQQDHLATRAPKINKSDAWIDWQRPATEISRQVRAFDPWPVAQTLWEGVQLRIWKASVDHSTGGGTPGSIHGADADGLLINTGNGRLCVSEVQLAGKRRMPVRDFLKAHNPRGVVLGHG